MNMRTVAGTMHFVSTTNGAAMLSTHGRGGTATPPAGRRCSSGGWSTWTRGQLIPEVGLEGWACGRAGGCDYCNGSWERATTVAATSAAAAGGGLWGGGIRRSCYGGRLVWEDPDHPGSVGSAGGHSRRCCHLGGTRGLLVTCLQVI